MMNDLRRQALGMVVVAHLMALAGCAASPNAAPDSATASSATIPIGPGPILLAISNDGARLYAAANNGLHIVDTASRRVTASLPMPPNPAGLALSSDGARAFLINLFSLRLAVIDTGGPAIASWIELVGGPTRPAYGRVAANSDGSKAYVVDEAGRNLVVVDVGQASPAVLQLDLAPRDVVLSADGRRAYICGCRGFCTPGSVQPFDTESGRFEDSFRVGSNPYRVVLSPDGKTLYTANLGDGTISVVDIASRAMTATIQVAPQLTDLKISRDGRWIYAVSRAAGQLAAIDASSREVRGKVSVGPTPREIVLSPDGAQAYVSTANGIAVVAAAGLIAGN